MSSKFQCLSRETLKEYLSGWSAPEQLDEIEAHLAQCAACEQTVVSLENDPDTLVAWVQAAGCLRNNVNSELGGAMADARHGVIDAEQLNLAGVLRRNFEGSENDLAARGIRIGPYELIKSLGRGGMGDVYLARHSQLGKQVAIKILPYHPFRNPHFSARFQREVRAAGSLEHPSIVRATDAGQEDGTHFLVMEYVDGLDLSRLARRIGQLNYADVCEIGRQVALGLSTAHATGIVHRDIKPSNLMLSKTGEVKILDFGLAQLGPWDEESAELTTVGQLMGTLDYMAPEQAERADAVDYRADLYSLGATLFRLATGRAPLAGTPDQSPLAKLRLLASASPPRLSTLREDAPAELVELVSDLLSRQPQDRPASAAHVAERLQGLSTGHDLKALMAQAAAKVGDSELEEPAADAFAKENRMFGLNLSGSFDLQRSPVFQELQPSSHVVETAEQLTASRRGSRSRTIRLLLAACASGIIGLFVYGGIVLWLENQKGTLTIETDATVTVQVRKDGKSVKQLQLEPGATSTRLYAGRYEIVLEQPSEAMEVDGADVVLLKQGSAVARIVQKEVTEPRASPSGLVGDSPVFVPPASTSLLKPGDALRIKFYGLPDNQNLDCNFIVQADGTAKLPIIGTVPAEGMTLDSFQASIREIYSKHRIESDYLDVFRVYPEATAPKVSDKSMPTPPIASKLRASTDTLVPGEAIELRSYEAKEVFNGRYTIQADATIKLPTVGTMSVDGMTVDSLQTALRERLKPYFREPDVEVFRVQEQNEAPLTTPNPSTGNTTVAAASTIDEPLYKGKPLSEWLRIVQLERDEESVVKAFEALNELSSPETKARIVEVLWQAVKKGAWMETLPILGMGQSSVYQMAFSVLWQANPGYYIEALIKALSESDNEGYKRRIIRYGILTLSNKELEPVIQWLNSEVFTKPSPYLDDACMTMLDLIVCGSEEDAISRLQMLVQSPQVTDEFWLEILFHYSLTNPSFAKTFSSSGANTRGWPKLLIDEVIKRSLKTLQLAETDSKARIQAAASIITAIRDYRSDLSKEQQATFVPAIALQINRLMKEKDIFDEGAVVWQSVANTVHTEGWEIEGQPNFSQDSRVYSQTVWIPTIKALNAALAAIPWETENMTIIDELKERLAVDWMVSYAPNLDSVIDPWNISELFSKIASIRFWSSQPDSRGHISWPRRDYDSKHKQLLACALLDQLQSKQPSSKDLKPERILEEAKRALSEVVVKAFDADSDGNLNYEEFLRLSEAHPNLVPDFPIVIIESIDLNLDEAITAIEYNQYRNDHQQLTQSHLGNSDLDYVNTLIEKLDVDMDHRLSLEECKRLMIQPPAEFDIDRDGMFDDNELIQLRNSKRPLSKP